MITSKHFNKVPNNAIGMCFGNQRKGNDMVVVNRFKVFLETSLKLVTVQNTIHEN